MTGTNSRLYASLIPLPVAILVIIPIIIGVYLCKYFLVAKLLYNYLYPSVRMSVRFRGKRDFLGP